MDERVRERSDARGRRARGQVATIMLALVLTLSGATVFRSISRLVRDRPDAGRWTEDLYWQLVLLLGGLGFGFLAWRWARAPERCGVAGATLSCVFGTLWLVRLVVDDLVGPWAEGHQVRVIDSVLSLATAAAILALALWVFLSAARKVE